MPIGSPSAELAHRLVLEIDRKQPAQLLLLPLARQFAERGDDELVALRQKTVRAVQVVVRQPRLEVAVLEAPDRVHRRVGGVDSAVLADRDVVEEDRALRLVALGDLARGDVDLDQLVDVGHVEGAVVERHAGRRVQALDPFPLDDGAVGPEPGDEAVAVLLHDGAGDVGDIDRAGGRILDDRLRLRQALDLPQQLGRGGGGVAEDESDERARTKRAWSSSSAWVTFSPSS